MAALFGASGTLPPFGAVLWLWRRWSCSSQREAFLYFLAVTLELALKCTECRFLLLCPQLLSKYFQSSFNFTP